eukprot:scaffold51557_cov48-Prasinocladus_malaysianus.AAC.2
MPARKWLLPYGNGWVAKQDTISSHPAGSEDRQFSPSTASVGERNANAMRAPGQSSAETRTVAPAQGSGNLGKGLLEIHAANGTPEAVYNGTDEHNGKRKLTSIMNFNHPTHLRWLEQAEAAQAVLQSSHEVLQSSHIKPQEIKLGPQNTNQGGPSGNASVSNGFLSNGMGHEFSLGHGGTDSDRKR